MRGLLSPSVCHRDVINSLRRHVCASSYVRMTVLFCPKSYLLLLLTSTAFFAFSLYCQPCHLPIVPLPSRVGSRVLTLGFIQICSLRGWKVVMKAKKNSLALSLTTSLVLLMKPKENSIFCPCYSFPPILHLFPLSACILSFSISGASDSQTKSLSPSVLFKTAWKCNKYYIFNVGAILSDPNCDKVTLQLLLQQLRRCQSQEGNNVNEAD